MRALAWAGLLAFMFASPATAQGSLPAWAKSRWEHFAKGHPLKRTSRITPALLEGDFDGDGTRDVALLVADSVTHKEGVLFFHRAGAEFVVGAGKSLGNGGDNFDWMDSWSTRTVAARAGVRRHDELLVTREGAGGGIIAYANGRYRWRQYGD
jgi:hypothetical protein